MQIKLYNFSKRKNSTKQPTDASLISTKTVYMKRETSVMNPTFLIKNVNLSANYCKWDNNYYFINDIVLNNDGMYEIRCHVDVLATCKSSILNTTANVMYASNSTKNIIDKRLPIDADVHLSEYSAQIRDITITKDSMGTVMLGITGNGSFGAYQMKNSDDITKLLDGIDGWFNFTEIPDMLKQLFYGGSASECLKSAISLPFTYDVTKVSSGAEESITLGNYPCQKASQGQLVPIKGYKITNPILKCETSVDIDWQYDDWRRNPPYTQLMLYLPFVGLINLPTSDLINDTAVGIDYAFNVTSGDFSVLVHGWESLKTVATASGNIAMPTAYGSTGIDTNKMTNAIVAGAGAIIGGAVSLATGGAAAPAVLGIAGGLASAAGSTLSALGGTGAGNGGLGGGATTGINTAIHLYTATRLLTVDPEDVSPIMGKPYFGIGKISSFSGYVQTEGFSLSGEYLEPIITEVNSMMNSGIYIE